MPVLSSYRNQSTDLLSKSIYWFPCEHNTGTIVGKGGHTPPPFLDQPASFSKIPPFLEIQDVPTFHRFVGKAKVLNNSCNQFVYNLYPQGILVLEECLKKWWKTWYNAFLKRGCQLEKGILNSYLKLSPA